MPVGVTADRPAAVAKDRYTDHFTPALPLPMRASVQTDRPAAVAQDRYTDHMTPSLSLPMRASVQTDRPAAVAQDGHADHSTVALSLPMRVVVTSTIVFVLATTFFLPMVPLSQYNHLMSNLAGWTYHR